MPTSDHAAEAVREAANPSFSSRRWPGLTPYAETYDAMRAFTAARTPETPDEIWLCEHEPVFTLGLAGRPEHVLGAGDIPVVRTDRGGQVTYHGPGQVVAYPLVDLKRAGYFVKEYVFRVEEAVIGVLADFGVTGHRVRGAPGVYVRVADPGAHARLPAAQGDDDAAAFARAPFDWLAARGEPVTKIAALGIKVSRGAAYHGVALNVAMDLAPFSRIDTCGYPGLATTDLRSIGIDVSVAEAGERLAARLSARLSS